MDSITVETDRRCQVIDVTDRIEATIPTDADGVVTITSTHTTCGIALNEAEDRLLGDFEDALDQLVPDEGWAHDRIDDNADAHVRSLLVGASETVPVQDGSLALGTWQSVLLVECDGPRSRTLSVAMH